MEALTDWIDFDFSVYEQAMYSKFQLDIGPTVTLTAAPAALRATPIALKWVDIQDYYQPFPREKMTLKEHEEYRVEYSVAVGEKIRFDNLLPSTSDKHLVFDDPSKHNLTLGNMYEVIELDGNKFGKTSKITILDDSGSPATHYRGRFTKMNISAIPEPNDDDII